MGGERTRGGGTGWHHIVAGALAAAALPLGVFVLHVPFLLGIVLAVPLYAGVILLLAPRSLAARIDGARVGRAQAELVAGLIVEGEIVVARLREAARGLRGEAARRTTGHLAEVAQAILDRLAAEPGKLPAVRRFLTYYLPRSAEVAEGLAVVEGQLVPDAKKHGEIVAILGKLDQAFTFYADGFAQAELDTLDVELKLLGRALAEDLAAAPAEPAATRKEP